MQIGMIINPKEYPHHLDISNMICSSLISLGHTISVFDIGTTPYDHITLNQIKQYNPDVLITLDLAGFRFRSQSGECALNLLYSKNLNLVWGRKPEYDKWLKGKISLSMLFYDATGSNNRLSEHYQNLLYYKWENTAMPDNWHRIWADFEEEIKV